MTCWIEDDLYGEEHAHPPTYPKGRRPCNAYCRDGAHVTVAFVSHLKAENEGHVLEQFSAHHPLCTVLKAEPAHEVTPDMYPERRHFGSIAAPGEERLVAWLVHWKPRWALARDKEEGGGHQD